LIEIRRRKAHRGCQSDYADALSLRRGSAVIAVLGDSESGLWIAEVDGAACLCVDNRGSHAAGTAASLAVGRPFSDRSCALWKCRQNSSCPEEVRNSKTRLGDASVHGGRTYGRACRGTKSKRCRHRDG
jgi:hypothetical protein